jgi:hypothetical protein
MSTNATTSILSDLYTPDAAKMTQLFKHLDAGTHPMARNSLRMNTTLTNQILFVTENHTIGVISYPMLTTDENNKLCVIGFHGNDIDNKPPIAILGENVQKSFSTLVPASAVTKFKLPVLTADVLNLEPPAPAAADAGPGHLNYIFTDPDHAPRIGALPATFSNPNGIEAPLDYDLRSGGKISEDEYACEAGRMWVNAVAHAVINHQGKPIHTDATTFNATDLDPAPFANHEMATSIIMTYHMLKPDVEQYKFVLTVAREAIRALRPVEVNPAVSNDTQAHENAALERQARIMNEIVKSTIATNGPVTKDHQSRTDRETTKANMDTLRRYQLMFAQITTIPDPNNPDIQVVTVVLPDINEVFKEGLEISKIGDAVRLTREQVEYHFAKKSMSTDFHDASMNYDPNALDATLVLALKTANWADKPLSLEPSSITHRIGIYHFAAPRTKSWAYEQRYTDGETIYRQETVGEDKSRIKAKAHDLDHTGKMDSVTDLHTTVANLSGIFTYIAEQANKSELWKMIVAFHAIWLHADGRKWIDHHISSHPYIIPAIILEIQNVICLYAKVANCMEYRLAVRDGKQIAPRVYEEANGRARHIITQMNNLIPTMTLGRFVIEPLACHLLYQNDQATNDKKRAEKKSREKDAASRTDGRNDPRTEGRIGGGRRDEGRAPPPRENNRNNNPSSAAPPDVPAAQVAILKGTGLVKYSGSSPRIPQPTDILELNGPLGLVRLCMTAITRDRFCRWGNNWCSYNLQHA